ncbi:glycine zipper domain-containing protein [Azohydromonas australica]|uniref:glycine zipper domain-containing protein n=1 Tax=Azohydromonas australica TaxID=364039 RepID=UPI0004043951|nr:glycine zipper domain-containing protein [Azohydromonas australica]
MTSLRVVQQVLTGAVVASLLAGCASPADGPGPGQGGNEDPCSVGTGAVAGAAVGALIGAMTGDRRTAAKGAVIGGAAGALLCVAVNVQSRQTKPATQVDREYERTRGRLPEQPQLVSYMPAVSPPVVQRGRPVRVNSTLELVNGSVQPVSSVREEIVVFSQDGQPIKSGGKLFTAASAGRFENSFEVTLPQSAPQGVYALKTNVFVNDRLAATRDLQTRLVWDGREAMVVAGAY